MHVGSSAKTKLEIIIALEKLCAESAKGTVMEAWTNLPMHVTHGADYSTVSKWCRPDDRRTIQKGAAQAHASGLMRIDKHSRKTGQHQAMERALDARFKARRKRGCRVSARWLTHTARHIMTEMYPADVAARFKGGRTWRLRWRSRFGKSIRKKSNVKNTTWEDTEPILQLYFRNLRRRLQRKRMLTASAEAEPLMETPMDAEGGGDEEGNELELDEEDDSDAETDVPPAPRTPPDGFSFAATPPTAEQLTFRHLAAVELVGKSILYHWEVVGWLVGVIQKPNTDGRLKIAGVSVNFLVFYQHDDNESKHVLSVDLHGSREVDGWVLLEQSGAEGASEAEAAVRAAVEEAVAEEAATEAAEAARASAEVAAAAAVAAATAAAEAKAAAADAAARAVGSQPAMTGQLGVEVEEEQLADRVAAGDGEEDVESEDTVAGLTPAEAALEHKWGLYPPWRRGNVDQIPLPFINGMDTTYEETGVKRVAINQLGPALSKRMCTGQLAVRAEKPPPPEGAASAGTYSCPHIPFTLNCCFAEGLECD